MSAPAEVKPHLPHEYDAGNLAELDQDVERITWPRCSICHLSRGNPRHRMEDDEPEPEEDQ
jgi:hypothetical protein